MNASTFTARVVASTGADVAAALSGAVGALSGPLHGGAPSRVLPMLDEVDAHRRRRRVGQGRARPRRPADGLRPPRLPRRGSARPRAAAHRARARARRASRSPRRSSRPRSPSCTPASPTACSRRTSSSGRPSCSTSPRSRRSSSRRMFACARVAGWSAHILEQKREGAADPAVREVRRPRPAAAGRRRRRLMAGRDNGIVVEGLVREFKKGPRAVDGIDLEVAPGEIYGFLGPERRRQVDDRPDADDAAAADRRHARASRGLRRRHARAARSARRSAPRCRRRRSTRCLTGREHMRLQATLHGIAEGRAHAARGEELLDRVGLDRRRGPQGRRLLGRDEAAPRPRARARPRAAHPLPRRADDRPRPAEPHRALGARSSGSRARTA